MNQDIEQVRIIEVAHSHPKAQVLIDEINKSLASGWVFVVPPTTLTITPAEHRVFTVFILGKPRA